MKKNLNILALDPALKTGFAVWTEAGEHPALISGMYDLSIKKGQSDGIKWLKLERWLRETAIRYGIELISCERAAGMHKGSIIHHAKLLAIIEKFGVEHDIQTIQYSAKEIKKFATGNGNASKDEMVGAAQYRYDWTGTDDDEADALHLLMLTKTQF